MLRDRKDEGYNNIDAKESRRDKWFKYLSKFTICNF